MSVLTFKQRVAGRLSDNQSDDDSPREEVNRSAATLREMLRFLISGIAATLGNVGGVFAARYFISLEAALVVGIACGLTISFLMTKLFAFRSYAWNRSAAEGIRFLLVYAVGATIYWAVSFVAGRTVLPHYMPHRVAELVGVLIGAGVMMVTSYVGHRFFTYRRIDVRD